MSNFSDLNFKSLLQLKFDTIKYFVTSGSTPIFKSVPASVSLGFTTVLCSIKIQPSMNDQKYQF